MIYRIVTNSEVVSGVKMRISMCPSHGFSCVYVWPSSHSLVTGSILNIAGHYCLWFLSCVLNLQTTSFCVSATFCSSFPSLYHSWFNLHLYIFAFFKTLNLYEIIKSTYTGEYMIGPPFLLKPMRLTAFYHSNRKWINSYVTYIVSISWLLHAMMT